MCKLGDIMNWLEKEMNKNKLFYFKQINDKEIASYFKINDRHFATFYIDKVKEVMNWQ